MKKEIFNQYLTAVVHLFSINKDDIFTNTKRKDVATARQLLYYLCYIRPMSVTEIQKYMTENGYNPQHPPIVNGIKSVKKRIENDGDYESIISRIQNSVFI
jgi:chromosomal replication initiation ATPase DnaA